MKLNVLLTAAIAASLAVPATAWERTASIDSYAQPSTDDYPAYVQNNAMAASLNALVVIETSLMPETCLSDNELIATGWIKAGDQLIGWQPAIDQVPGVRYDATTADHTTRSFVKDSETLTQRRLLVDGVQMYCGQETK